MPATPELTAAAQRLAAAFVDVLLAVEASHPHPVVHVTQATQPPPSHSKFNPMLVPLPVGLLTSREAAKYLSVSTGTLFNKTAPRGPIPAVKIGARVAYAIKDLDAAVEQMKAPRGKHHQL